MGSKSLMFPSHDHSSACVATPAGLKTPLLPLGRIPDFKASCSMFACRDIVIEAKDFYKYRNNIIATSYTWL